jgi:hypothetical protein
MASKNRSIPTRVNRNTTMPAMASSPVLAGNPIRDDYLIVDGGQLAGAGAHSYSTES